MTHPLLEGPRGRHLCMTTIAVGDWDLAQVWSIVTPTSSTDELVRAIGRATPRPSNLAALMDTVDAAMYWQAPHDEDAALALPAVVEALEPIAEAVAASALSTWWRTPMPRDQAEVEWIDDPPRPLARLRPAEALSRWKANVVADEIRARERPRNPDANWSGEWWSIPHTPATTRPAAGLPAVGLALVEDSFGWESATVTPVTTDPGARVFEITAPEDWAELVRRYPLDVPLSRRHDWYRTTGFDARWAIPDWTLVSTDFDAVHLTVLGYLTTAGRALEIGDRATVLAGWSPDWTYWLADRYSADGAAREWHRDDSNTWSPATRE